MEHGIGMSKRPTLKHRDGKARYDGKPEDINYSHGRTSGYFVDANVQCNGSIGVSGFFFTPAGHVLNTS